MIAERAIKEEWIIETLKKPDRTDLVAIDELHFIKKISENGNRYLKVVVNPTIQPKKVITLFFDRRIKG